MEIKKKSNLFRVPQINKTLTSSIIGVFDASGSMFSSWPHAARTWNEITKFHTSKFMVTFSTKAAVRSLPLDHSIGEYEPSSTNICGGFLELNKLLNDDAIANYVTIVFVSDGEDDNKDTLSERMKELKVPHEKTINFISVGVGSCFPTFVAMQLRDIYHNGAISLPPLFLIDNVSSPQNWDEQMNLMKNYIEHFSMASISPAVKQVPWLDEVTESQENSWVYSYENEIFVNNSTTAVQKIENLSFEEYFDLVKGWLGELQLLSIRGSETKNAAKAALDVLNDFRELAMKQFDGNVMAKLSFKSRLDKKEYQTKFHQIQPLIHEIKLLSEDAILCNLLISNILLFFSEKHKEIFATFKILIILFVIILLNKKENLSPEEAAKRLAIGTQVGKFHNAAMHLRGITVDDYLEARKLFIKEYEATVLNNESDQEPSVISLQNQKEVFRESDLIDGLNLCKNQYDLVEAFPIVGHAIEIQRTNAAMINPYLVQVVGVARHHKVIDSVSLQSSGNQLIMNIGGGEQERVNAILPLFSKKDADLRPLVTSKLYSILMTFNVMGNADTCFDNAYMALLANTCTFMLAQPQSGWRDGILDLIGSTIDILYSKSEWFVNYSTALINTPRTAVVTENPAITTKCEDLSKAICYLFYAVWSKGVTEPSKISPVIEAVYSEMIGRSLPGNSALHSFFDTVLPEGAELPTFEAEQKFILEKFTDLSVFFSHYELKSQLEKEVDALSLKLDFKVSARFDPEDHESLKFGKLSLSRLEKIYEYFLPDQPHLSELKLISLITHAIKYNNSYERNTTEIQDALEDVFERISQEKETEIIRSNNIFKNSYSVLLRKFQEYTVGCHFEVSPTTLEDVKKYCEEHGLDASSYQFNQSSDLLTNACMSMKCPYYMKLTPSLALHLESDIGRCPALHKSIKQLINFSDEEIFKKVLEGECMVKGKLDQVTASTLSNLVKPEIQWFMYNFKEDYLKLIRRSKEKYLSINKVE